MPLYRDYRAASVYFMLFIGSGAFVAMNLILVVVLSEYRNSKRLHICYCYLCFLYIYIIHFYILYTLYMFIYIFMYYMHMIYAYIELKAFSDHNKRIRESLLNKAYTVLNTDKQPGLRYSQITPLMDELYYHYYDFRKGGIPVSICVFRQVYTTYYISLYIILIRIRVVLICSAVYTVVSMHNILCTMHNVQCIYSTMYNT